MRDTVASPAPVKISLFNLMGEEIGSEELQGAQGSSQWVWNLQNRSGADLSSGLYFYVLRVGEGASATFKKGKIVVLR
ncbi:MAG TPA: hypothetical protein VK859_08420 [bacterium]|nr:hypothetical protein [bacterium]